MVATADGSVRVRTRGVDINGIPTCQPRFYIDGIRFPGDISLKALVSGASIRAVEYYNPLEAPGQFTMGMDPTLATTRNSGGQLVTEYTLSRPCAIIVIWTDVGFGEVGA